MEYTFDLVLKGIYVHFTFRDVVNLQADRFAMGSPLGPVLAWKFMVGTVYHILSMLNSFHPNTQFTYETEYSFKLAFVHVMLCRDEENVVTTAYRKVTNADVYLNWNLFASHSWKWRTLKILTQRAYMICSTTEL